MKKSLLIITLLAGMVSTSLFSQEDEIRYGAKIGLNIASIKLAIP